MNPKLLAQSLQVPNGTTPGDYTTITGPDGFKNFANLGAVISAIVPYVFFFAGTAMLLMLILGGFTLLTGANDPKKLEQGKQMLTYAIVGFLIVFLSYWMVQLFGKIFGLTEFKIFGI